MKSVRVCLLALMFVGCAGATIEQTSIVGSDGTKMYLLKEFMYGESNRKRTVDALNERANKLCPSGYELMNEEREQLKTGRYKLHWQIKCNNLANPFLNG
jgi:hypothetical protein